MALQKLHNLPGRDLLLECFFNTFLGKLPVQHVWELSVWLHEKFKDFSEHFVLGVGPHSEVSFDNNKFVVFLCILKHLQAFPFDSLLGE